VQIRLARAQFDKTALVSACLERLLAEHVPSAHQFALDDFRSQVTLSRLSCASLGGSASTAAASAIIGRVRVLHARVLAEVHDVTDRILAGVTCAHARVLACCT
jgi:hypothetical protein